MAELTGRCLDLPEVAAIVTGRDKRGGRPVAIGTLVRVILDKAHARNLAAVRGEAGPDDEGDERGCAEASVEDEEGDKAGHYAASLCGQRGSRHSGISSSKARQASHAASRSRCSSSR